jgi:DNA polymerase/3'-5' exonuclease PolX
MRRKAQKMGFLLNQKGLFKDGKEVLVKNERELFAILEMDYLTPQERDLPTF